MVINERRRHRRIHFERPVSITTRHGNRWSCASRDFCMEGMGLHTDWQAQVGEELRVVFNTAAVGSRPRPVTARGRVCHCIADDGGFSLGVQFYPD